MTRPCPSSTYGIEITAVEPNSLADVSGIRPHDFLIRINGHPIRDVIDVQYYGADDMLRLVIHRNNISLDFQIVRDDHRVLGFDFTPMQFTCCGNHCTFCFIDQNPKGLRPSLYFKDEDFRLSFLHGNYVTLTHVKEAELHRITEQRLSPLYISVHAIHDEIRYQMLGLKRADHLLDKLTYLAEHGIEMHAQVVLCPKINDGAVLDETIQTLAGFYPELQSLAIVPVGLTKHRNHLTPLESFHADNAADVIRQITRYQVKYRKNLDTSFVFLSDEFYLLAGVPLPEANHYEQYWQIENGVGMMRDFLEAFHAASESFPSCVEPVNYVIVTGMLAAPVLNEYVIPVLRKIKGMNVAIKSIENQFYGPNVTVSGLLTGRDIYNQSRLPPSARLLLPENCVNSDGLFLDDWTPECLSRKLGRPVQLLSHFEGLFE